MAALSSNSSEWMTPPWLVEKCRAALGGYISLDAATSRSNPVGADESYTPMENALGGWPWHQMEEIPTRPPTLFLNPPGERSGKLVREFWRRWDFESTKFHAAVWVDFNLDHLRFISTMPGDSLVIPRKRIAWVDPATQQPRKGAQIGGFLLFRGNYNSMATLFPPYEYVVIRV